MRRRDGFCRPRLCWRVRHPAGEVLQQQRRHHSTPARRDARPRHPPLRLLLLLRHVRQPGVRADGRAAPAEPDQPLRREQVLLREYHARLRPRARPPFHLSPLLQRGRRGPGGPHRREPRPSEPITTRPTAPASATTSTSSTWPRPTASPSTVSEPARKAASTTWAPRPATRSGRSSSSAKRSQAAPCL